MFTFEEDGQGEFGIYREGTLIFVVEPMHDKPTNEDRGMVSVMIDALNKEIKTQKTFPLIDAGW